MPARNQQHQIGKLNPIGQPRRQRMAFEVIDRHQRLARSRRQRLAGGQPHQHAPDQPRPRRRRDPIDL